MTASEFHEKMLCLLRREPFQPFEIELADGRQFRVENPLCVSAGGGSAALGDEATGDIILFDYRVTRSLEIPGPRPSDPQASASSITLPRTPVSRWSAP